VHRGVQPVRAGERRHSARVLIVLSVVQLLVGGGFGPPILGIVLGVAATRINAPLTWWRARLSMNARHFLAKVWPWSFVAGVIAWLCVFPGSLLLDYVVGLSNPSLMIMLLTFSAFALLLLTIMTGFSYDLQRQRDARQTPALSG
jgi:hypothetical protein